MRADNIVLNMQPRPTFGKKIENMIERWHRAGLAVRMYKHPSFGEDQNVRSRRKRGSVQQSGYQNKHKNKLCTRMSQQLLNSIKLIFG